MKDNKGFTLVEIVVVSMILVVLATMLIPTMVRYLTKGANEKILEDAENILSSAQIKFYSLYAEASHNVDNNCIITGEEDKSNDWKTHPTTYRFDGAVNCDIHWNPIANEILSMAGLSIKNDDPCAVIIGTGRYDIYADPVKHPNEYDPEKAYTVYCIIFQPFHSGNTTFVLYADGTIDTKLPKRDATNEITLNNKNGDKLYLQLYYIKNGKDNNNNVSTVWNYASSHMKK